MAPLAHTLALLAMTVATAALEVRPLDMAQNSFDDQYLNCDHAMTEEFLALKDSELQQNKNFARVWAKATAEWEKKLSSGSYLSSHQAIALLAYTMDELYEEFNAAVHEAGSSRQEYRDNFHFKALHFLLTQAMRRLREIQGEQCQCLVRGVRGVQFKAEPGDIVRFGQFMAMSPCEKFNASGMDTVFYVVTCRGVDICDFSSDPSKKQVLIPPFHTFKVNYIRKEGGPTQIHLNIPRTHSNYNCEWLQGRSSPKDTPLLGGLLLAAAALAVATGSL